MIPFGKQQEPLRDLSMSSLEEDGAVVISNEESAWRLVMSISNVENLAWSVRSSSALSADAKPSLHRNRLLCTRCSEKLC